MPQGLHGQTPTKVEAVLRVSNVLIVHPVGRLGHGQQAHRGHLVELGDPAPQGSRVEHHLIWGVRAPLGHLSTLLAVLVGPVISTIKPRGLPETPNHPMEDVPHGVALLL